jgi:heme/copper-type cytochrome/quinol oxidase subunit 2
LAALAMLTEIVVSAGEKSVGYEKTDEAANTWLFMVVIFFIVAGFLLSLIPLAKAQNVHQRGEHLLNDFRE